MNNDESPNRIAALRDKWNVTEEWIEHGEDITSKPITLAINRLRYAGGRIVDAFDAYKNSNEQKTEAIIANAEIALDTARYGVVDAIYDFYSGKANKLRGKIGAMSAQAYFLRYAELFALIRRMGGSIRRAIRLDRGQRETIYCKLIEELPELERLCSEFAVSVDAIAERMKKAKQDRIASAIAAVIGWVLAIAVIVVSFLQ